jgi:hypothetical protein
MKEAVKQETEHFRLISRWPTCGSYATTFDLPCDEQKLGVLDMAQYF